MRNRILKSVDISKWAFYHELTECIDVKQIVQKRKKYLCRDVHDLSPTFKYWKELFGISLEEFLNGIFYREEDLINIETYLNSLEGSN